MSGVSEYNIIYIDDNNRNKYNIVCFKDYIVDNYKFDGKDYQNVYIKIDNKKLIKINGYMKRIITSIDRNEFDKEDVLYTLHNLEKVDLNGNSYYSYKLLTKNDKRDTYIINYCDSFTHYINLFKNIPTICTIEIINNDNITLIDNKDKYIYQFLSLEEVKRFNKNIYNYIVNNPKINKFDLIFIQEKEFEGKKYYDFKIEPKLIRFTD